MKHTKYYYDVITSLTAENLPVVQLYHTRTYISSEAGKKVVRGIGRPLHFVYNVVYVAPAVANSNQKYVNELLLGYLINIIIGQKFRMI